MATKRDDSLQPEIGRDLCRVRTKGGKYRGYRKDILTENLSERDNAIFMCPRCKGILRELRISTDGEQFCSCCGKEGDQANLNVHMNNMILCFKCCCPLMVRGCGWLGTLVDCENHLDTCGYVQEKCKLKCGDVLQRNNHVTHEKENCIQRIVKCEHCKENFKFWELTEHLDVCPKMKVSCELKCGVVMCRDKVTQHIDRDCREKEIECPFVKYKCVRLIKRQNLNTHLEENETEHLKMKLNAIEDIVMKQSELIEKQNETIERMSQEIGSLNRSVKQLRKVPDYPIHLKWLMAELPSYQESIQKQFEVVGYLLQFNLIHHGHNLVMDFCLKDGLDYYKLDWPFRAKFITRLICRNNPNDTKEFKSEEIEVQKVDLASKFRIATMTIVFGNNSFFIETELEISVIFC